MKIKLFVQKFSHKRFHTQKRHYTDNYLNFILLLKNYLYIIKILIIILFNWNNIIFIQVFNLYITHNIEDEKIEYQFKYNNYHS